MKWNKYAMKFCESLFTLNKIPQPSFNFVKFGINPKDLW